MLFKCLKHIKKQVRGTQNIKTIITKLVIKMSDFLTVQWLRLRVPNAGDLGSIPGQGARFHMPQLKSSHPTTKTQRC